MGVAIEFVAENDQDLASTVSVKGVEIDVGR